MSSNFLQEYLEGKIDFAGQKLVDDIVRIWLIATTVRDSLFLLSIFYRGNFLHRRLCPAVFNGDLWYPGFIYSRFACGGDPALANVQSPSRQMVTGCGEQEIKVE
ncbi:hypothetical protein VKT23_017937 [Stygiomarasmius scandens]|uniref:Uncharacterized protein n=1 Tax=Marasmiellus scandens TaxID=2682957 RepID=A0ABR1ISR0_9AGAR